VLFARPWSAKSASALSVSPGGAFVLGLSDDATLTFADIKTRKVTSWRLPDRVQSIEIAPDGDWIAARADESGALVLYNIGSSEPVARFSTEDVVNSFSFGRNADDVVVGLRSGSVQRWKPSSNDDPTQRRLERSSNDRVLRSSTDIRNRTFANS